jgi:hypothetical protein
MVRFIRMALMDRLISCSSEVNISGTIVREEFSEDPATGHRCR